MFAPIFSIGQNITNITVTDEISCYGDFECVDILIENIDFTQQWDLWIWREITGGNQLTDIYEDFTSNANFTLGGGIDAGNFNYCFELNGTYSIEIFPAGNVNVQSTSTHTTAIWPDPIGITQLSSNTELICNGDNTGSLRVAGTGGTQPLTFTWTGPNGYNNIISGNGTVISEIFNLEAGDYNLELNDANGCTNNSFVGTITEPLPIFAALFQDEAESCTNANDAEISAVGGGGNGAPYSYFWNTGQVGSSITVGAGTYSVTLTDSEGCASDNSFIITLDPIEELVADVTTTTPDCPGLNGNVFYNVSGGTGTIFYGWPTGTSTSNTNNLPQGNYNVVIQDQNGCAISSGFSIVDPTPVTAEIVNVNNVSCFGGIDGSVDFFISGGSPFYGLEMYQDGILVPLEGAESLFDSLVYSVTLLNSGNYELVITDANNCLNTAPINFVVNEPSEIILDDTTLINIQCYGENTGTILASASGGTGSLSYTWTDVFGNIIANSNSINNLASGTYNLSIQDQNNCVINNNFNITEPTPITLVSSSNTNVSCFGENDGTIFNTVVIGGTPPYNYIWQDLNNIVYNEANPEGLGPSTYSLTVVDNNNCDVFLENRIITEPNYLGLQSNQTFVPPTCHDLNNGEIEVFATGGSGFYNFTLTDSLDNVVANSSSVSNLSAGSYNLLITDVNDCTYDTSFTFDNPDELVFNTTVTNVSCNGLNDGSIFFDYDEENPPYSLSFNNQLIINQQLNLEAGIYTSTLTDANGCEISLVDTVTEPTAISYNVSFVTPSCSDEDLTENNFISNGQIILDIFGGTGDYLLIFENDTSVAVQGITSTISNVTAGNYSFDIFDSDGCYLPAAETVDEPTPIDILETVVDVSTFGSNTGQIEIDIIGGEGPYQFSWIGPSGFSSGEEDIFNLYSGTYTLVVEDALGCTDSEIVQVNEPACAINISANINGPNCPGENAEFNFIVTGGLAPYNCTVIGDIDNDGSNDTILDNMNIFSTLSLPLVIPSGVYTLLVEGSSGCLAELNVTINDIDSINVNPTLVDASCFGFDDGQILIDPLSDISGGTAPYSVSYQGLDLNPVNPFNLTVGEYIVNVQDDNNCPAVFYYEIFEPSEIVLIDTIISQPNCFEGSNSPGSDGQITVIPDGGTGNFYTYNWNDINIPSIQNPSGLSAGIYQVKVSDATNCSSNSFFITLDEPETIDYVNYLTTEISCHDACDGGFEVITTNSENEIFNWYALDESPIITNSNSVSNLCDGFYEFSIENNFGCFVESQSLLIGSLSLSNPAEFGINVASSSSVPYGVCSGIASVTSIEGVPPFDYSWSTGETSVIINDLCGGVLYSVEVTDSDGCTSFEQFYINEDSCIFDINEMATIQPECHNDDDGQIYSVDAFTGGAAPYNVKVFDGGFLTSEFFTNDNYINIPALEEGNYNIIVEEANGCISSSENIQIINPDPITYSYTVEGVDCFNDFNPEAHVIISGGTQPYEVDFFGFELFYATEVGGIEQEIPGINLPSAGEYLLVIEDDNNCSSPTNPNDIFKVVVDTLLELEIPEITTTNPNCNNGNDGSASISIIGGVQPYQITWYEVGETLALNSDSYSLDSLSFGEYYVEIRDANNCLITEEFTIDNPSEIIIDSFVTNPTCEGLSDASISTDVSGGNEGYSYLWGPGGYTTSNIFNLSIGEYILSVYDNLGCEKKDTFNIVDPDPVNIELNKIDASCFGTDDGSITSIIDIPTAEATYQWYIDGLPISAIDGGNSFSIANLGPANYSLEVTNSQGCKFAESIILSEPEQIESNLEINSPNCYDGNDGSIISNPSGGTSPFTFVLTDSESNVISNSIISENLFADTYDLLITDNNDCEFSEEIILENPDELIVTINYTDPTCNFESDGTADYEVNNNSGVVTQIWNEVIGLNNYNQISFSSEVNNLSPGNYMIEVTDELGCQKEEFFTINETLPIALNYLVIPSNCSNVDGATVQVTSDGALPVTYNWIINQGDEILNLTGDEVNNLPVGPVYVSATDANGCIVPQTEINIPQSNNPLILVQINQVNSNNCIGDNNVDLNTSFIFDDGTAVGPVTYQWYENGSLIPSSEGGTVGTLTNLGPGEYTVEVTDLTYGCTTPATIVLENPDLISVDVTDIENVSCYGDNTGSANVSIEFGTAPYNYYWTNDMGVDIASDNPSPENLVAGSYELIVEDINGCRDTTSFEITQNDSISISINNIDVSCYGYSDGILTSTATGGIGSIFEFEWKNENGDIISIQPSVEDLSSQNYSLTVTDNEGCESSVNVLLEQPEEIVISNTTLNVDCHGSNSGEISINATGGSGVYTFIEWQNSNSQIISTNNNAISNLFADTYSVYVFDSDGCQAQANIVVNEPEELNVTATGYFQSCLEGFIEIDYPSGGTLPYSYNWVGFPTEDENILSGLAPGSYTYQIIDGNGCILEQSVEINGTNEINTTINAFDVNCNGESTGSITVDIINPNLPPYLYSINDLTSFDNIIGTSEFTIDNLPQGEYTIYLKDNQGCIDSTETVVVNQPEPLIFTTDVNNVNCFGETSGQISYVITGGILPYEISESSSVFETEISLNGIDSIAVQSGAYDVIVQDGNGCISSQILIVNEPSPLLFEVNEISNYNGYNLSCFNSMDGNISFNISGGTASYTLNYDDVSTEINSGEVVQNLNAGSYLFNLVDANNCSIELDEITLNQPEELILENNNTSNYNGYNVSCYGQNNGFITANITGGVIPYDYSINGGLNFEFSNGTDEYTFNNISAGQHVILVQDGNGCVASDSILFTSPDEIMPILSINQQISCFGSSDGVLLAQVDGGVSPFTYTFSSSLTDSVIYSPQNTLLIENVSPGIYELNITDVNGCYNSISSASQIIVSQPDEISYDVQTSVPSCNSDGDGALVFNNFDGGSGGNFMLKVYNTLNGDSPFLYENPVTNSSIVQLNNLSSDEYVVIITDNSLCSIIDTIAIGQPEILSVETEILAISCAGADDGALNLTISGGNSPYNVLINDVVYNTDEIINVDNLSSIQYDIEIIDMLGCNYNSSVTFVEPDPVMIESFYTPNTCYGQNYGSAIFNASGGITPYTYYVTDNDGALISDTNYVSQLYAGTYLFTVTDFNGCSFSEDFTISEPEQIIVEHEISNVSCTDSNDGSIITSVSNYQLTYEIFWQNVNLSGTNNYNLGAGDYVFTVIDGLSCFITDTVTLDSPEEFSFEVLTSDSECSYTNNGQLTLNFNGSATVALSNEDYSEQIYGNSEIIFNDLYSGEYNLTLTSNTNCNIDTIINIYSADGLDCVNPEPTFSPNFDGMNDEFKPLSAFNDIVELMVFNRWGEKLFHEETINPVWDGMNSNGESLPSADYYYIIKFNNREYKDITGIITLLK